MALLFWDSFDHYNTAKTLTKWTYAAGGLASSYSIGAYGRYSTNGLRIQRDPGQSLVVRRSLFGATPATLVAGASVEFITALPSTYATVWQFLDLITVQLQLRLNSDGSLEVYRGGAVSLGSSAAGVITADTQHYVEMKALINGAAGTVEVRVDNVTVITIAGANTQQSANSQVTQFELGGPTDTAGTTYQHVDDLYVCDDSGLRCNDFLGDTRIACGFPAADGVHTDWTPSAGVDHYAMVDEVSPDDDATYNSSGTATDRDSFDMDDLPGGIVGNVHAVCAVIHSRKDESGIRTLEPSVRVNGTDYDGTGVNIPNNYAYHNLYAWEVDPDTAAPWVIAAINAMEAGYHLSA